MPVTPTPYLQEELAVGGGQDIASRCSRGACQQASDAPGRGHRVPLDGGAAKEARNQRGEERGVGRGRRVAHPAAVYDGRAALVCDERRERQSSDLI